MEYFDDPNLCLICFGYHPLKYCKYFKTFTTIQRKYLVNVHRYCPKCFSKAHLLDECTLMDSCSKCPRPHHTMLHPAEEECAAHKLCPVLQQCRSATCGKCAAKRCRELPGVTPYTSCKSFRNEQSFCNTSRCARIPQGTLDEQETSTSKGLNTFAYRCNEPDIPSSSQRTTTFRHGYAESNSVPSFLARTPNRETSTYSSCNLPFTMTSPWQESVAQPFTENPSRKCCSNQTFPFASESPISGVNQGSRKAAAGYCPNTQPVRFSSVSPKSELASELSFSSISKKSPLSPTSECLLQRSSLERYSFSTRRSRSPSIESECCVNDRAKSLLSRSAAKTRTSELVAEHEHKAFTPADKGRSPETTVEKHKVNFHSHKPPKQRSDNKYQSIQTKPTSGRKSYPVTKRRPRKQTLVEESQLQHETVTKRNKDDHNTSTSNCQESNESKIQHQQLRQIQLYLQQLLGQLKRPKEYWHTPANWRRQALLRQELSQLKAQLKQLIQDIQRSPNLQTQSSTTCQQQEDLKTLFQQLLSLLQKCHALSSSRQLISSIQQLKEHLQHHVDTSPIANDKVLSFQQLLKELEHLEGSCQEAGRRLDLLQKRLSLRIILRHLLKVALEQLTDMLS